MRLIAQVEPVGMMTSTIRKRERTDGERQRLERSRRTVARRFAGQDARDVRLQRESDNRVSTARLEDANAQPFAWQPVVKVWRRTETGEAPRRQGATSEHTGSM